MKTRSFLSISILFCLTLIAHSLAQVQDPLPAWNDGPAKQAIVTELAVVGNHLATTRE